MPHASTSAVDVFGGTGLEDARLSRINAHIIPFKGALRGTGQALGYRLVGKKCGEALRGRVRGCGGGALLVCVY